MMIELFPGLSPKYIKNLMDSNPDIEGANYKSFSRIGNTSTNDEFLNTLEAITKRIFGTWYNSMCVSGGIKMPLYESTQIYYQKNWYYKRWWFDIRGCSYQNDVSFREETKYNEIKNYFSVSIAGEQTV